MRRGLAIAAGLVLATAALLGTTPAAPASAAPAPGALTQCNDTDNGGGRAVECDVTITNYLDLQTNVSRSDIVARTCTGAAGAAPLCTVLPVTFPTSTTDITQCNGSGLGGGATVTCTVNVVNTIVGSATLSPATVNQCIGSGTGGGIEPTLNCNPVGTTSGATITQCNGSANGGGAQNRVTCTVGPLTEPSTQSTALPVTINQCNGSAAGGSLVTCSASLSHTFLPAGTPFPAAPVPSSPVPTEPTTPTAPAPTAPAVPPATSTPTTPSPLIPVATGQPVLAESGATVQPALYVAGGAMLLGALLFGGVLVRRRISRS